VSPFSFSPTLLLPSDSERASPPTRSILRAEEPVTERGLAQSESTDPPLSARTRAVTLQLPLNTLLKNQNGHAEKTTKSQKKEEEDGSQTPRTARSDYSGNSRDGDYYDDDDETYDDEEEVYDDDAYDAYDDEVRRAMSMNATTPSTSGAPYDHHSEYSDDYDILDGGGGGGEGGAGAGARGGNVEVDGSSPGEGGGRGGNYGGGTPSSPAARYTSSPSPLGPGGGARSTSVEQQRRLHLNLGGGGGGGIGGGGIGGGAGGGGRGGARSQQSMRGGGGGGGLSYGQRTPGYYTPSGRFRDLRDADAESRGGAGGGRGGWREDFGDEWGMQQSGSGGRDVAVTPTHPGRRRRRGSAPVVGLHKLRPIA
jgi:hypothetical protein